MRFNIWSSGAVAFALTIAHAVFAAEKGHAIKIGGTCDRTGTSKIIGLEYCPAVADYMALVNRKGGVLGHKLEYTEIESAYMPDRAIDAYERLKRDGAVT